MQIVRTDITSGERRAGEQEADTATVAEPPWAAIMP
jgi:hypothetical protein